MPHLAGAIRTPMFRQGHLDGVERTAAINVAAKVDARNPNTLYTVLAHAF